MTSWRVALQSTRLGWLLAALGVWACGSTASTTPESRAAPTPASTGSDLDAAAPHQPEAAATTSAEAAPADLPAGSSPPPGVSPLDAAERKEANQTCKPLLDALEKQAKKQKTKGPAVEVALSILRQPPKVSGIDVSRCAELLIRDLQTYRAKVIENEAMSSLRILGLNLSAALEAEPPQVCPSAPPTPEPLSALAKGAGSTDPSAWRAPGWQCARFAIQGPHRFQYELRASPSGYEVVARGYPAGELTELYVRYPIRDGRLDLEQPVLRRARP